MSRGPHLPPNVRRLFRLPWSRASMVREVDEELQSHLDMRVDELCALGMSEPEARAEAARRFGDADEYRAYATRRAGGRARRLRVTEWIEEWAQDVGFARRQVARAPGVAAVAVLTLALGIGANTAIFSVVHRLLLSPLPYPNGNRVVMPVNEDDTPFRTSVGIDVLRAWQARTHAAEAIAGASEFLFTMRPDDTVDTIPTASITANFLPTLGLRPVLGRGFVASDERGDNTAGVAMIGFALWQRSFGGRSDVLGRTVEAQGRSRTIVGVTPRGLALPMSRNPAPDVWLPATLEGAADGGSGGMPSPTLFVVLRDGVPLAAAERELQTVARSMPAEGGFRSAEAAAPPRVRLLRPQDFLGEREVRAVQVLFVAVGALLLIACANVANLLLAHAWTRQREFALRSALGAGRWRLARQVLAESVSLALAGGVLGVGVAWLGLRVIVALRPPSLDELAGVRLEPAVLLWCLGVSLGTGVAFGCAPAVLAGARQVGDVLRTQARGGSAGVTARRVRAALVVVEVALSLALLVGAGLLVRSLVALQRMPLGFEPRGLVYADVLLGPGRYHASRPAFRDAIVERLRGVPGVTGVAIGTMPGKGFVSMGGIEAEAGGRTVRVPTLGTVFVTPDYFRVAGIAVVGGRLPAGPAPAPPPGTPLGMSDEVLVNRELARRVWSDGHAVGARVREAWDPHDGRPPQPWSTVVGIVEDTRMPDVRGDVAAVQVFSLIPARLGDVPFVVRSTTSADDAAPLVKRAIASLDGRFYVRQVLSGDAYLRDGLAPTRFATALLAAFAGVAMLIAAVGLYGVIAYGVSQRTREIGVRVAIGADPRSIVAGVVGEGMRLAAAGVLLGAAGAAAATRVLRGLLYGIGPADPPTFVGIALLVVGVALAASYVPARRALRIDPARTLRED